MPPIVRYINQRTANLAPLERHQVHQIVYQMDCLDRVRSNLNERVLVAIEDCLSFKRASDPCNARVACGIPASTHGL